MTKRVLILLVMVLALAGCGSDEKYIYADAPTTDLFTVHNVEVNGRMVPCVVYDDSNSGSQISCDWEAGR